MPTVVFETRGKGPLVVRAPAGGSLADLCDTARVPVEFSCRSADCGTCLVAVLEGQGELIPEGLDERAVLDALSAPSGYRLACQALMRPGLLPLRIAPAVDAE